MVTTPKVLVVCGYFDWFSGYQEIALTKALSRIAETEVVASDRVSPIFSDAHLEGLEVARRYRPGTTFEFGTKVTRFSSYELRSMVWSHRARKHIRESKADLIIQIMPGQLFPAAASLVATKTPRVALYGDNSAMWANLGAKGRAVKGIVFSMSKGLLYTFVNRRCVDIYGYTPETTTRLRRFSAGRSMKLLPLSFDRDTFFRDEELRSTVRRELGYSSSDRVIVVPGKINHQKQIDKLVTLLGAHFIQTGDVKLLIVGADDGSASSAIRTLVASDPALRESVQILGFAPARRLNAIFNAADIGVWPVMPAITIQQAMATGLEIVLPMSPWVSHLLRPGSGTYFSTNTIPAGEITLTQALEAALVADHSSVGRAIRSDSNHWLSSDSAASEILEVARR